MPSPPVAPPDDGLIRSILESAGGFVLGAAVTLVTFRTRLSKLDGRLKAHDEKFADMANDHTVELTRLRAEIHQRHAENKERQLLMDRRGKFTLRLVASVARKLEVDKRVDDEVIAFLTEDTED